MFVCFSTEAVHVEVVGDLTTASFLGALKRFISRRGVCTHIHSDNAKTFKGTDVYLQKLLNINVFKIFMEMTRLIVVNAI